MPHSKTTTLLLLLIGAATGLACNAPFQSVAGGCYYVEQNLQLDWAGARTFCHNLGGDGGVAELAVFDSCETFTLLAGYLGFNTYEQSTLWVGAHTEFTVNNWRWVSGMPLASGVPFWAHAQGHDDGEDCAAMDSASFFQLSDFDCSTPMSFVCELPEAKMTRDQETKDVNNTIPVLSCPIDSVQVGEYCYWFSSNLKTWSNAEDYCRTNFLSNQGELFAPSTCDEFTKVAHHLDVAERDRSHWVGAADSTGDQEWYWVSGTTVPGGAPFWATGEPNDHILSNFCGLMSHKKRFYMEDEGCMNLHYFICKLHSVV
ncbi:macrophage mannose receptor 1-like [Eriocheir sinensis]|uniref:macrophage mannose receptor 1-like n=1 Tax=Eriocheir sinensis TaxID=95602 RepID=UPI0021C68E65|nr:macrophage mannose receptor 1-like [Eriocheir sinensis]